MDCIDIRRRNPRPLAVCRSDGECWRDHSPRCCSDCCLQDSCYVDGEAATCVWSGGECEHRALAVDTSSTAGEVER